MEGAQLQNIKGIGDKLSQKIIDEHCPTLTTANFEKGLK